MSTLTYTTNQGKSYVYQMGNKRAIRHSAGVMSEGVQWEYEVRENSQSAWESSYCRAGYNKFVTAVENAI